MVIRTLALTLPASQPHRLKALTLVALRVSGPTCAPPLPVFVQFRIHAQVLAPSHVQIL